MAVHNFNTFPYHWLARRVFTLGVKHSLMFYLAFNSARCRLFHFLISVVFTHQVMVRFMRKLPRSKIQRLYAIVYIIYQSPKDTSTKHSVDRDPVLLPPALQVTCV